MAFVTHAGDPIPDPTGEGEMVQILQFPSKPQTPSSALHVRGESAQILFFTGVRYERDVVVEKKAPRRSRRRRPQGRTKSA
jgi:hypothetical protein